MRIPSLIAACVAALVCLNHNSLAAESASNEQRDELAKVRAEMRTLAIHLRCVSVELDAMKTHASFTPRPECNNTSTDVTSIADAAPPSPNDTGVPASPPAAEKSAKAFASVFYAGVSDATIDRDADKGLPRFQVSATTASSQAAIKFSGNLSSNSSTNDASFSSWSASLSAPLSKSDPFTSIATLDGLANSFSLTLGFNKFFVSGFKNPTDSQGHVLPNVVEICALAGIKHDEPCDLRAVEAGLKKTGHEDRYPEFLESFISPDARKWTYGLKGTLGYESYDFFQSGTLASQSDSKVPWSAGAYIGFIPPRTETFLSAGAEFQRAYKPTKQKIECPVSTGTIAECVNGSIGPPKSVNERLVYLEGRTELAGTAMDLKITHDFESGDNGVDLPIYLLRDDKGDWNGGVRVGWTNTDHFAVGIFVGGGFSLLP
jgi:hypothetical protein